MQMTMYNKLPPGHPLWPLLEPQSQSLIDFDFVLLMTEMLGHDLAANAGAGSNGAAGAARHVRRRAATFFDDDPLQRAAKPRDRRQATSRSRRKDWDAYPVVGDLLDIWEICRGVRDGGRRRPLHERHRRGERHGPAGMDDREPAIRRTGNIRLPDDPDATTLDRGADEPPLPGHRARGRKPDPSVVNPALAFVSNFPPCLQSTEIPEPGIKLSDARAARRDCRTRARCGGMTTFYFTFAYSSRTCRRSRRAATTSTRTGSRRGPSEPACNAALFKYRADTTPSSTPTPRTGTRSLRGSRDSGRTGSVVREEAGRAVASEHRDLS